jgi:hypothetical protein
MADCGLKIPCKDAKTLEVFFDFGSTNHHSPITNHQSQIRIADFRQDLQGLQDFSQS